MGLKQSIAKELFLEYFVDGEVDFDGTNYKLKMNLYSTESGKIEVSKTFVNENIFTLIDETSLQLRYDLGIPTGYIESTQDLPIADMLTHSLEALKEFSKALSYVNAGNFGDASLHLEKAIEIDEAFTMAYIMIQSSYSMTNQGHKVLEMSKKGLDYAYRLPEPLQFLPKITYFATIQDMDKLLQTMEMHFESFPYDIGSREILSMYYTAFGMYEEMIELYHEVLKIDPTRYNYLLKIGSVYDYFIKDYDKAMDYYSQYLEYFPNDYKIHAKLARFYSNRGNDGDREMAIESWNKVALLDPGNITASRKLVSYDYEGLEQIENTYKILNDCTTAKDSVTIYEDVYEELIQYGMIEEAINVWKKYDKIRSGYEPFAMYAVDNLFIPVKYVQIGRIDEGLNLMVEYEKLYKEGTDFTLSLGRMLIYHTQEDGKNAEKYLNEFIKGAEELAPILIEMIIEGNAFDAKIAILNKEYDKAIELINKNRFNYYTSAQSTLSKAYRLKGDLDESKEIIEKMCDDGGCPSEEAEYEAALVYYDLGQHDKARKYLNSVLEHYKHADITYKPVVDARETLRKWDATGN